jgi:hypothetical protein
MSSKAPPNPAPGGSAADAMAVSLEPLMRLSSIGAAGASAVDLGDNDRVDDAEPGREED